MKYYCSFCFEQNPETPSSYILVKMHGRCPTLNFRKYSECAKNDELEISNKYYMYFGTPRNPSIKKYFPKTIELAENQVLTSTEEIDSNGRIFGDAKKIGRNDLILGQFSKDRKRLVLWFVRDKGVSRDMKQKNFKSWVNGEILEFEDW